MLLLDLVSGSDNNMLQLQYPSDDVLSNISLLLWELLDFCVSFSTSLKAIGYSNFLQSLPDLARD